ncbi:MAG: type IV pilus assembly protein PilM [Actinomycetota bacterium]
MGLLALGRGSAPVGLDIGNKTFRIAQLKPSAHKPILINYASKDTPFGLVDEGEIADVDGVAKVLSDFWRERKISEKKVVVGIANQKVIVRIIEMPYMTEAELKSAIQFQVSDYIPIPIEEAIIDFQIISERENDLQGKVMDVLVVAARKEMIERVIMALEKAGLRPVVIDVSSFAFARAVMGDAPSLSFEDLDNPKATAMINVGSNLTDIVVMEDGIPRFTRISNFGSDIFVEALMEALGISLDEAEDLAVRIGLPSRDVGDDPADVTPDMLSKVALVNTILEQQMMKLVAEIRRSLDYYLVQAAKAKSIDKIILSGSGANLRNFRQHLKRELQIEVELGHPLNNVQIGRNLRSAGIVDDELSLATCLGLAMRGLDL